MMRVMTFNVRGSFHDDGVNNWDKRADLNVRTIKKYDPDIIGFQEVQEDNLVLYDAELSDYDYELGLISIRKADNYHRVPIFWKKDRFTKLESGGYYLGENPQKFEPGWDATFPRAVTWIVLQDANSGAEFVIVNTHFPHVQDKDETRLKCAELIIEHLQTMADLPHLVMADFNAMPGSAAYKTFEQAGYVDSYKASPYDGDMNTFHYFKGDDFEGQGVRIDWILGYDEQARFSFTDCRIITDAEPPIYPGDHYPVLVEMDIS